MAVWQFHQHLLSKTYLYTVLLYILSIYTFSLTFLRADFTASKGGVDKSLDSISKSLAGRAFRFAILLFLFILFFSFAKTYDHVFSMNLKTWIWCFQTAVVDMHCLFCNISLSVKLIKNRFQNTGIHSFEIKINLGKINQSWPLSIILKSPNVLLTLRIE